MHQPRRQFDQLLWLQQKFEMPAERSRAIRRAFEIDEIEAAGMGQNVTQAANALFVQPSDFLI